MTTQESFKRRIRERMARTGERYGAARRALLPQASGTTRRAWIAQPAVDDDRVRTETGRGWDDWTDAILAGPGRDAGHTAIAAWLREEHGVDPWWAQSVTVGFERITGLRLPGQMPDGSFSVSRSRTLDGEAEVLRAAWEDDDTRGRILPGVAAERRSRPGVKVPRFAVSDEDGDQGVVSLLVEEARDRVKVVLTHERIADLVTAERWKAFWELWLDDLAASLAEPSAR